VLVLSRADVEAVLSMDVAIEAVARGARESSAGRATIPLRVRFPVPEAPGYSGYMPGYLPALGALGIKIVGNFPRNRERGLALNQGVFLLLDGQSGQALAVMDASALTELRTAALTGAAGRLLARPDARTGLILGAGAEARSHVLALAEALQLDCLAVWARRRQQAEAVVAELAPRVPGLRLEVADSAAEATRQADVVAATTSAEEPVLFGDWLGPGTFVSSVGHPRQGVELDPSVVERADVVSVDDRTAALAESTDLRGPLERGVIRPDDLVELGELVGGTRPGRSGPDQVILFKSVGFAAADLAAGQEVYRMARERGLGVEVGL
jgi:ornithine cyclodeaminase/alanine dehydrogenase-like protein (mu-crystallin family)